MTEQSTNTPKLNWQEYIRSGANYHLMLPYVDGITIGVKNIFGQSISHFMAFFEGTTLYWYYVTQELAALGRVIVSKLLESVEFRNNFFVAWNNLKIELDNLINKYHLEQIKELSDRQLAELYGAYFKQLTDWCGYCMSIDATDESLMADIPARIKDIMKRVLADGYTEKEYIRVYNILTQPEKFSYMNEERLALLHLAKDLKAGTIKKEDLAYQQSVKTILDKYWWTDMGWAKGQPKNESDVAKSLEEIAKSGQNLDEEINKIKALPAKIKADKAELEKTYQFSQDQKLIGLLDLFDQLVEYHDLRKETQMKTNYWHYMVFVEVAQRKKIEPQLLDWCNLAELESLLIENKFDQEEMKRRSINYLRLNLDGVLSLYSREEAKVRHDEVLGLQLEQIHDLQGISASAGKVAGPALVALSIETAKAIKPGEILVTGMTTPEFVPAMKKAAAIVTDEGGITCHAAIISRELGIPCIVGTKFATRLIKTGDLVEVAANHGIVRLLNK